MAEPSDPDLGPVRGVSLDLFARISRELSAFRYDPGESTRIAMRHGIDEVSWLDAASTWALRLRSNAVVAEEFRRAFERGRTDAVPPETDQAVTDGDGQGANGSR
jgi:hypothetical protein